MRFQRFIYEHTVVCIPRRAVILTINK